MMSLRCAACGRVRGDGGEPIAGSADGFASSPRQGEFEAFGFEGLALTEVDLQAAAGSFQCTFHGPGGILTVGEGVDELGGEAFVRAVLDDHVDIRGSRAPRA
ncbi:hypothetical protein GCM10010308_60250 [Streptomyces vinaceusdrappus]|nr:hypothetical protein GCM10010308_60250 [Streptomyces vinaceusdrappus]